MTQGTRLKHFPHALNCFFQDPRYRFYESPPVGDEIILKVHTPDLLEAVKRDHLCSTAWHSVGGVLLAGEKIAEREIRNAFAFIGAGGHHSGRDFFGGYCCFNDVVIAITVLREHYGIQRYAILDTDAHHGDGTRDLVKSDPEVLHVCMCSSQYESPDGTKVDIPVHGRSWFDSSLRSSNRTVSSYAQIATQIFEAKVREFKPDLIFWYFGFDTHEGDYGDIGLTLETYLDICRMIKGLAEQTCNGRLEVVLGGGSRSDIARHVIPPIVGILGDNQQSNAVLEG